jgi:hypothetical protein
MHCVNELLPAIESEYTGQSIHEEFMAYESLVHSSHKDGGIKSSPDGIVLILSGHDNGQLFVSSSNNLCIPHRQPVTAVAPELPFVLDQVGHAIHVTSSRYVSILHTQEEISVDPCIDTCKLGHVTHVLDEMFIYESASHLHPVNERSPSDVDPAGQIAQSIVFVFRN